MYVCTNLRTYTVLLLCTVHEGIIIYIHMYTCACKLVHKLLYMYVSIYNNTTLIWCWVHVCSLLKNKIHVICSTVLNGAMCLSALAGIVPFLKLGPPSYSPAKTSTILSLIKPYILKLFFVVCSIQCTCTIFTSTVIKRVHRNQEDVQQW